MKYFLNESYSFSKTITESDVYNFADICKDFNPIHMDKDIAQKSCFHGQIAHGMLVASFISTVLGMYLPGPGTIYLKQELIFKKPVYINDTITIFVTIKELSNDKNIAKLDTIVKNQKKIIVVEGEALVKLPQ